MLLHQATTANSAVSLRDRQNRKIYVNLRLSVDTQERFIIEKNKGIFNVYMDMSYRNFRKNIRTEKYMKMVHFERDPQRRRILVSSSDESAKSRDSREQPRSKGIINVLSRCPHANVLN
jgi:hypothetical protein